MVAETPPPPSLSSLPRAPTPAARDPRQPYVFFSLRLRFNHPARVVTRHAPATLGAERVRRLTWRARLVTTCAAREPHDANRWGACGPSDPSLRSDPTRRRTGQTPQKYLRLCSPLAYPAHHSAAHRTGTRITLLPRLVATA